MLEILGRLTSEESREWVEPDSKEGVLMEREGAGDGGREDTREGISGSAERRQLQLQTAGQTALRIACL